MFILMIMKPTAFEHISATVALELSSTFYSNNKETIR